LKHTCPEPQKEQSPPGVPQIEPMIVRHRPVAESQQVLLGHADVQTQAPGPWGWDAHSPVADTQHDPAGHEETVQAHVPSGWQRWPGVQHCVSWQHWLGKQGVLPPQQISPTGAQPWPQQA